MADAFQVAFFATLWPGLLIASAYAIHGAVRFHHGVRRSLPGRLVMVTVIGWLSSLAGALLIGSFYLVADPAGAAPIVLPIFVLWAGSLVVIVYVTQGWGREAIVLASYYAELEQMDRMKSQFINNVAHELNTPITPLKIQLNLLLSEAMGDLNDRQRSSLKAVERNVARLGVLVDQVLLASMVQSGRLPLHIRPVPADVLLLRAQEQAQIVKGVDRIALDVRGEAELQCDPDRMSYVLAHLVAHAAQAGPVRVDVLEDPGGVRLAVHDPAPAAAVKDALRPFGAGPDPIGPGLGLELFIARGIVERHGGTMRVEEGPAGAVVMVRVPRPLALLAP